MRKTTENTMGFLTDIFNDAKGFNAKYVAVSVKLPNFSQPEIIINSAENVMMKLNYYANTYQENLEHKLVEGLKILDFTYANTFAELEEYFFEGDNYEQQ